ncbi:hypothetical protein M728_005161 (plasmid) [Ensifer sp. WSM1721]
MGNKVANYRVRSIPVAVLHLDLAGSVQRGDVAAKHI